MMRRVAVMLSLAAGVALGADPETVSWNLLAARVGGNKVAMVLPDGTHVQGRVRGVDNASMRLKVTKTSDRRAIRKGEQSIPRGSVTLLYVTEYRTMGRWLTTLGALAAAGGIVAAQSIDVYEGPAVAIVPAAIAGGMAGVGVAGYFTGKRIDKRVTAIRVVNAASTTP